MSNIRVAYSRSIGRPSFNQLDPYRMLNFYNESIIIGNPDLKPMVSDNFDLLFEHYFMNVGEVTLGFYFKKMSDFVYRFENRVPEVVYAGWVERTYLNGFRPISYHFQHKSVVGWQ